MLKDYALSLDPIGQHTYTWHHITQPRSTSHCVRVKLPLNVGTAGALYIIRLNTMCLPQQQVWEPEQTKW